MWVHPDATERNITAQFPEVFNKHDFLYFSLPDGRMSNFFDSAQFLDASRKTKDLAKLFSAVQRAMQQGEYKDPWRFLKSRDTKARLADATSPEEVARTINELSDEYNQKYGMIRQARSFYEEYTDDADKKLLLGKLCCPAYYKLESRKTVSGKLRVRVDFLLSWRNDLDHAATYRPLPDANHVPLQHELRRGDPESVWLIYLTFEDLYEITRKAMSQLWLQEYETYWNNGGKEIIEKVVAEVKARCDELNAQSTGK